LNFKVKHKEDVVEKRLPNIDSFARINREIDSALEEKKNVKAIVYE